MTQSLDGPQQLQPTTQHDPKSIPQKYLEVHGDNTLRKTCQKERKARAALNRRAIYLSARKQQ